MTGPEEAPPRRWRRGARWVLALGLSMVLLAAGRYLLVDAVFERSGKLARRTALWMSAPPQDTDRPSGAAGAPAQPLWDWELVLQLSPSQLGAGGARQDELAERSAEPAPRSRPYAAPAQSGSSSQSGSHAPTGYVPAQQVLDWVRRNATPRGQPRPAGNGMGAGIELSSVAQLGIGLRAGDRLVEVAGVPVTDRTAVVAAVLKARRRGDPAIGVRVQRSISGDVRDFRIAIEQPYLDGLGAPPASAGGQP